MNREKLRRLLGLQKDGRVVGVDIGSTTIKAVELLPDGEQVKLVGWGMCDTPSGGIQAHAVAKVDAVGQALKALLVTSGIKAERAVLSIPGPAVFSKRLTVPYSGLKALGQNLSLEASNYIPHSIDAVDVDFQVLRRPSDTAVEILLVAARKEVVASYKAAAEKAGLSAVVADIDAFALGNMFEANYPECKQNMVALLNIGAKYTSVDIIDAGHTLFTGDVSVGGRLYTESLSEALAVDAATAEKIKAGDVPEGVDEDQMQRCIEKVNEHIASELARQVGFFWNTCAAERPIESVFLSGGASQAPGLIEALAEKTKISCKFVDALKNVTWDRATSREKAAEWATVFGVGVGLALRRTGDKVHHV